jgi:hypothetical protein
MQTALSVIYRNDGHYNKLNVLNFILNLRILLPDIFKNKQQALRQAVGNNVTVDQLIGPRQDHIQINV